jgi:hypothetical protein
MRRTARSPGACSAVVVSAIGVRSSAPRARCLISLLPCWIGADEELNPRQASQRKKEERMVLHGWKQIARYLGCGIRSAQRWEEQCGLPVTRPRNHLRSPVLAQTEALDGWASGGRAPVAEAWETRCRQLEQQLQDLKRQVALLGGQAVAECGPATSVANQHQQIAAKASAFEA